MCFEMEAQSSGGDIGPECLQSNDSYSLDVFGDIDGLIVDLLEFATTPPTHDRVAEQLNYRAKVFQKLFWHWRVIGGSENGPD